VLSGKSALVTGAGQGIGREIALTLAQAGCAIAVNDLVIERARDVVKEIIALGGTGVAVAGSVASALDVEKIFADAVEKFGKLDILINNAGIILKSPFWEISEADWDKIILVNLKSVFLCCQAAASYMRPQHSGKIVNIASIAGKRGGGILGNTAYAASKAGVMGLSKGLARELGPYNINVNVITPGLTETEMTKDLDDTKRAMVIKEIPLGRAGKPQDIANAVLFLASPLSNFISGEMMDVDGGFMMD
jgi:3-oxoacyl-[acyl-carrier protein] reductase